MSLTIKNLAGALVVLMLIPLSCTTDSTNSNLKKDSISEKIKVSGEDTGAATKTTLSGVATSWIAGTDRVGIYSSEARTATGGGGSAVVNVPFTAANSAKKSTFTGTMYWGQANTAHTFYAYYPYTEGSAAATAVPVSLPATQTQSASNSTAHISALDFLIATPLSVTSPDNTDAVVNEVDLKYNHLFTILEFQIKGSGNLMAVRLITNTAMAFSSGTIDITQTTPATGSAYPFASQTGTSSEVTTTLTTAATLTSTNTDTKVYMVINPCTPAGNCLIGLSSDGTTWQYIYKAAPTGGFKRGIKYVVSVDAGVVDFYTVNSSTGKVWMDRNLGASRVATGTADSQAYGYYYQWGRGSDGHQILNSSITGDLATSDTPGHDSFITSASSPYDWRNPQNGNLWQGLNGINNPCPAGFRIPTETEWTNERVKWATNNAAGAFASPLKLTVAGYRHWVTADYTDQNIYGSYWSSTILGTESRYLLIGSSNAYINDLGRAYGFSVRCIKD
ncbi:MAG: fimbrillin family protein [Rikenellaceae bacterium]|nr:fimbrillin family protein [Rikenellaceae bacterium]